MLRLDNDPARNLLDVILDVHMTTTGSLERSIGSNDQENDVRLLKDTLRLWVPGHPRHKEFDDAVKHLIEVAIEEYEKK